MDITDAEIMRYLSAPAGFNWNPRESMRAVGKQVGIDEDTVRARIYRMQESGFMREWYLVVNPSVFGHGMARIQTGPFPEANKKPALEQIALIDGVQWVFDLFEGGFGVVLYYANSAEMERRRGLVGQITNTNPVAWEVPMPPARAELDETDWTLIAKMFHDPRAKMADLAEAAQCSVKTVRRRLDALEAGKVAFVSGTVDYGCMDSGAVGEIRIHPNSDRAPQHLQEAVLSIPGSVWANVDGPFLQTTIWRPTVTGLVEVREKMQEHADVDRATMDLMVGRYTVGNWLEERISFALSAAGAYRKSA